MKDRITLLSIVFFRNVSRTSGGFAIAAGLEQVIEYIQDLHFDPEDIEYLRGRKHVRRGISGLSGATSSFTGDIYAVPEGTPVFPKEPILTVRAPAIEAQLIETYLLLTINHQSLIATKANRIVRAAEGRTVLEFGSRRAQGADGAIAGRPGGLHRRLRGHGLHHLRPALRRARRRHHGPCLGADVRHASTRPSRPTAKFIPHNATLLVDTYNTLKSRRPQRHPGL